MCVVTYIRVSKNLIFINCNSKFTAHSEEFKENLLRFRYMLRQYEYIKLDYDLRSDDEFVANQLS